MKTYDQLIPPPKGGAPHYRGTGRSQFGRRLIAEIAEKHYPEAKEIALHLASKGDLEQSLRSFHRFVHQNFRFIQEGRVHLLQTLSRAWHDRTVGINCEDATIINGQLCLSLGLKCIVRGIAQLDPEVVNHVYLIVPKNQRTGSLKDGYYALDSTHPEFDFRPESLRNYDVRMKEADVAYYTMNSPRGANNLDWSWIKNLDQQTGETTPPISPEGYGDKFGWLSEAIEKGSAILDKLPEFGSDNDRVSSDNLQLGAPSINPPNTIPGSGRAQQASFLKLTGSNLADGVILVGVGVGLYYGIKSMVA